LRDSGIFKLSMVDVQQGDGMAVELPSGALVLMDGGENKLFARHVAKRFRGRGGTVDNPLKVEAIIVTHGDADHYAGLNIMRQTEAQPGLEEAKRLFIAPQRIFHNGLVKAPTKTPDKKDRLDTDMFGRTLVVDGIPHAVDLYDDPRKAPPHLQNKHFQDWADTLNHWNKRVPDMSVDRVAFGDKAKSLESFFAANGVEAEVQGPFTTKLADGENTIDGLVFFREPESEAEMHLQGDGKGSFSASHTVNGHSIALHLSVGAVRISLTGDLNRPSMKLLGAKIPASHLEAEIVKAPHHGSHDFDFAALKAMRPVVAIVSSGDEKEGNDHIHPRATLMSALGKVMRMNTGVIFTTELAAFFAVRDYAHTREELGMYFGKDLEKTYTGKELQAFFKKQKKDWEAPKSFFAMERTNYGIIHIRTDGSRVLAFTHSGEDNLNEAYVFDVSVVDGKHVVRFRKKADTA
jgi:hypothetical protein